MHDHLWTPSQQDETQIITLTAPPAGPASAAAGERHRRVPALDGLRALAIIAVLLYHAGFGFARGGFLGVDAFFVLSGFLITGLLVGEHTKTGSISLRRFYVRRARRLLPALFTVVAGVCLYVVLVLPHEAATLRSDALAALTYVTNWWLIFRDQSYFGGTGRPSLLINLWSLAVEEQFYLLWPLLLGAMLKRRAVRRPSTGSAPDPSAGAAGSSRAGLWTAFCWTLALAAGSALLMRAEYSPWSDPSRVYYGSDTRAFELFIGAALALAIAASGRAWHAAPTGRWRVTTRDLLGLCSLGGLGYMVVKVPDNATWLFPGGLLVASGFAVLAIRGATAGGRLARVLSTTPFVWLGERSYSLYLWHWPVFDVTRPGADLHLPAGADFALRAVISLALADLTFRHIERPIREGALGRTSARCRAALRERRFGLPAGAATLAVGVVVCAVGLGNSLVKVADRYPVDANAIAQDSGPALALTGPPVAPRSAAAPSASTGRSRSPAPSRGARQAAIPSPIPTALPTPPPHPPTVAFVGDSLGMTLLLNKPRNLGEYLLTIDDTTEGCGFLGGDISSRDGERRDLDADCPNATSKWRSRVSAQRPDIVVLMIGGWDEFDDRVDGTTMTFGSAAWDANYTARLGDAVSKLKATGVPRIELALLPCYRPVPEQGSGYWPERGDDARTRHINTLLTNYARSPAAAAGRGAVVTLQPPAAFCTDAHIASDRAYRWDGTHYYKPGSALYFETAIPQLLAPLP